MIGDLPHDDFSVAEWPHVPRAIDDPQGSWIYDLGEHACDQRSRLRSVLAAQKKQRRLHPAIRFEAELAPISGRENQGSPWV